MTTEASTYTYEAGPVGRTPSSYDRLADELLDVADHAKLVGTDDEVAEAEAYAAVLRDLAHHIRRSW